MSIPDPTRSTAPSLILTAVPNLPEIGNDDDVAQILLDGLLAADITLQDGDVLVIAHKIISKAEGRTVNLFDVHPGDKAREMAARSEKDPRLVELILRESEEISRTGPGLIIVRHNLGFTSANAGIDRSNVLQDDNGEIVLLLPKDPDKSAERLHQTLWEIMRVSVGIVIADSHGRPFRLGTVGVAIGVAGLPALWDRRGEQDRHGYQLQHTEVGTADEIASSASLLMGQAAEGLPVVHIRGLSFPAREGRASDLVRPMTADLYR
jgi:coenzyme F420-0:L-glutamate ligase/coenzyme F420-1:gamma-L-glutamate ligase